MWNFSPRSWLDKLVGCCVSLLIGATALYMAVRLIEAVAVPLLIIAGVAVSVGLMVMLAWNRYHGW